MKENSFIGFLFKFSLFSSFSCTDNPTQVCQWTKEEALKFLDSIEITKLIAAYSDADGCSFIVNNDPINSGARKVTYVPNFPVITDNLVQTGIHQFTSLRFRTIYIISDTLVVAAYYQKIIHPSSNWQGQAPWLEMKLATYPRLDRRVK